MSAAIQQAITTLESERGPLAEQLARIDAAIVALKNISRGSGSAFATEPARTVRRTPPETRTAAPPRQVAIGPKDGDDLGTRLLSALSAGPLSTGHLTAKARGSKKPVQVAMAQLAGKGLVHSTGTRRSQLWHLGAKGSSGPKEAESRRR